MEGVTAQRNEELLLGDTAKAFAAETVRLLRDPALRERLGRNGRSLAESQYDWQIALQKLNAFYQAGR